MEQQGVFDLPIFISPHWSVFIAFALAVTACAISWNQPPGKRAEPLAMKLMAASICFLAIAPIFRIHNDHKQEISIEAFDVGQAQSLLINFTKNGRIILDGGGSKSTRFDPGKNILTPVLTDNKTPALSGIISSHPDLDHVGGLFYLIDKFSPPYVFHNGREAKSGLTEKWRRETDKKNAVELARGDRLQLGDPEDNLILEVLHPPRNEPGWKGNSASLVLRLVKDGEGLALFTGDAEKDTLKFLVGSGQNLKAKILFAPHHGSDRSLYAPFYNTVSPEAVIASCGFENRWNYPGKNLRKFLEKRQIPLLDTGTYGRIKVDFKNGDLSFTAAKPEGRK